MDRRSLGYVRFWYVKHPDKASRDLHNMLLADAELAEMVRTLTGLFAMPGPQGRGVYVHHG